MTEEQRSQAAFSAKTRRAAGLLAAAGVGSALTARCGDARASPPWLRPKSLAAGPLSILKQALTVIRNALALACATVAIVLTISRAGIPIFALVTLGATAFCISWRITLKKLGEVETYDTDGKRVGSSTGNW